MPQSESKSAARTSPTTGIKWRTQPAKRTPPPVNRAESRSVTPGTVKTGEIRTPPDAEGNKQRQDKVGKRRRAPVFLDIVGIHPRRFVLGVQDGAQIHRDLIRDLPQAPPCRRSPRRKTGRPRRLPLNLRRSSDSTPCCSPLCVGVGYPGRCPGPRQRNFLEKVPLESSKTLEKGFGFGEVS